MHDPCIGYNFLQIITLQYHSDVKSEEGLTPLIIRYRVHIKLNASGLVY